METLLLIDIVHKEFQPNELRFVFGVIFLGDTGEHCATNENSIFILIMKKSGPSLILLIYRE